MYAIFSVDETIMLVAVSMMSNMPCGNFKLFVLYGVDTRSAVSASQQGTKTLPAR